MSVDPLPLPDAACRAIVRQAVEWVLVRFDALSAPRQNVQDWWEYPELLKRERSLDAACLAGDSEATKGQARSYCIEWLNAIKQRRNTTGDLHE